MIDLNSTLLVQMVNFLLLILILNFLLYKPVFKIIEKRNKKIEESNEEVSALNKTVEDNMSKYEEKIRSARSEAAAQRDEIKEEGAKQGKEITDKARGEISETIEDFKARLQNETDKARNVLRDQTRAIATEISTKVLGRGI